MAETSFPSHAAIPQSEVRRNGDGWNTPPGVNGRADASSHFPLHTIPPGALIPPPTSPAPAPLTEPELRAKLKDAIAAKASAERAMTAANEAHERATRHVARCRNTLTKYVGLDAEIDAYTVAQLRGVGRVELSAALRVRLREREVAQVELSSAERAASTLLREMAEAGKAHKRAEIARGLAMHAVVNLARERLREEMAPLEQKLAAYRQIIGWADEAKAWQPLVQRLMDDPLTASLAIDVPDAPEPMPPVPIVPVEEYYRLLRAANRPALSDAVAEEVALERARKVSPVIRPA